MDDWPELIIGEVAQRAGVAPSAIRYYESIGVLPEPEREGGQRRYDESVFGKIAFIGVAQTAGFSLDEIRNPVDGLDQGVGIGGQMRTLSARKLDEVEALLERTRNIKGWLEVAQACGCETPADCALFPAPGEEPMRADIALAVIHVQGRDCRRQATRHPARPAPEPAAERGQ